GERTVRDVHFSVADPHGSGSANGLKRLRSQALSAFSQRLVVSHTFVVNHCSDCFFFTIDKAQILHRSPPHRRPKFESNTSIPQQLRNLRMNCICWPGRTPVPSLHRRTSSTFI